VPRLDLLDRAATRPTRASIPPLENGDRLTRVEFERRYDAMPEGVKAQLIDGIVYMASAVRTDHGDEHLIVSTWLGLYATRTPGVIGSLAPSVRLGPKDMPEPDALLRIVPEAGGLSRVDEDQYLSGPVELAVEVAGSSASVDLKVKKSRYLGRGILEYLVILLYEPEVMWFARRGHSYARILPDRRGILRSKRFPGLWLDARALLARDAERVLAVLDRGLRSREHAAFVRELDRRRRA